MAVLRTAAVETLRLVGRCGLARLDEFKLPGIGLPLQQSERLVANGHALAAIVHVAVVVFHLLERASIDHRLVMFAGNRA
jgi:hypothetical protein